MLVAGVDVGSTLTKVIIIDKNKKIMGRGLTTTGAHIVNAAHKGLNLACNDANIKEEDLRFVVGTGYGRFKIPFGDKQITEISCHAKGAWFLFQKTKIVIDIGGQDTKAIKIDNEGSVIDFSMNDKCAAGTGRFLEVCAQVLNLKLEEIGSVSLKSKDPVKLSNVCTVFVESEITSHLAKGRKTEDILRGVHLAIAARTIGLVRRVGIDPEITFTGGVSRNVGMVKSIEEKIGIPLNISADNIFIGAIGASLFALEFAKPYPYWEE